MPRSNFTPTGDPYHVGARCINKEWFSSPTDVVWNIFGDQLYLTEKAFNLKIHSFVLMSNHFHMLITTPNANLDQAMNYLLREVSKAINRENGNINQVFGGPYHWSVIKSRIYYEFAYKYVYRNPVEARICSRVESYPYSTLRGLMGLDRLPFPAFDNMNLISNPAQRLSWLNSPYPDMEVLETIRNALKKQEFELEPERYANL